jgi:hypothetical protein
MQQFRDEGKTFVLVSHDLDAVREMCDRSILLDHGRVVFDGPVAEGVELYRQRVASTTVPALPPRPTRRVRVEEVALVDTEGAAVTEISPSATLDLVVGLRALERVESCGVGVTVSRGDGAHLYELHTTWQGVGIGPLDPDQEATVRIRFAALLLAGHFTVAVTVTDTAARETWAVLADAARFAVRPAPGGAGLVDLAASVSVTDGPVHRLGDATTSGPIPLARIERRRRSGA